jgi:NitT/TauT family transport system ATP-binding protein
MKVEGAVAVPLSIGAPKGAITLGPDRFFDGRAFDPDRIDDYLAGFEG